MLQESSVVDARPVAELRDLWLQAQDDALTLFERLNQEHEKYSRYKVKRVHLFIVLEKIFFCIAMLTLPTPVYADRMTPSVDSTITRPSSVRLLND